MYIKDYKVHQVPKGSKGSKGYRESKESKGCRGYKGCEPDGSPIQPVLFVLASCSRERCHSYYGIIRGYDIV